ncbi:MAG: FHA domain-containing protein [Planctomycetes bacterium]|nr:FHA domain-containing protein [Planctomycetota bacterium]
MSELPCNIVPLGECPAMPAVLQPGTKSFVAGRSTGANLRIDHPSISRQHFSIGAINGKWTLSDLGSRHGTRLNGTLLKPRQPVALRNGDRIGVIHWTLRVDVGDQVPESMTIAPDSDVDSAAVQVMESTAARSDSQRMLELLIAASVSIYSGGAEAACAEQVVRACVEGTQCERALVVRSDPGAQHVTVIAEWPKGSSRIRPLSRTLIRAALAGRPVCVRDDFASSPSQSMIGSGANEAVCVPIASGSAIDTCLYLDEFVGRVDFDQVLSFAHALGRWCGVAFARLQQSDMEERQRDLLEELNSARQVQERMMGAQSGRKNGVMWKMVSLPGEVVAGDIFATHVSPDGIGLSLCLGDVSGKGLGPGLLMAAMTAHLDASLSAGVAPLKAVRDLSDFVCARAVAGQFATLVMANIDATLRRARVVDAGHSYLRLVDQSGAVRTVGLSGGVPLGVVEGFEYELNDMPLAKGDRLVIFSDGVEEQRNAEGEMLGSARVTAALVGSRSCAEDVDRLMNCLKQHASGIKYADDVTIASAALEADYPSA